MVSQPGCRSAPCGGTGGHRRSPGLGRTRARAHPHPAHEKTKRGLRLPAGDGRQAGGQAGGSHGRVRVETNLPRDTQARVRPGTGRAHPHTHSHPRARGRCGDTRGLPLFPSCSIANGLGFFFPGRKGEGWGISQRFLVCKDQRGTRSPLPTLLPNPQGKGWPSCAQHPGCRNPHLRIHGSVLLLVLPVFCLKAYDLSVQQE